MPCTFQPNPNATLPPSLDLSYIFELHVSACLDHLCLLSLVSLSFSSSCSSIPHVQCHPSLVFYSFYHVSLACLCLASLYIMLLCWHFHCASCPVPSLTHSDLFCIFSLCILTSFSLISLTPLIQAFSFNFEFYIGPMSCTSNPLLTNHIPCSVSCTFSSYKSHMQCTRFGVRDD